MSAVHFFQTLFLPHESNNFRAKFLHSGTIGLIISIFLILNHLLYQAPTLFPQILGFASQIPPEEIVRLTNLERTDKSLPILRLDTQLSAAAARKAADMFARNYWAHISPAGIQPWLFITEAGYAYRYAGENLARDFSDPSSIVKAWLASPSHKENLISSRYQDIGVAVVDGRLDGRETTLVVQMFGARLAAVTTPRLGKTASFTVSAAANTPPAPTSASAITSPHLALSPRLTPITSPFEVTRVLTFGLLGLFALILILDLVVIHFKAITRWTSKSLAHLVFIITLILAASTILRGRIM